MIKMDRIPEITKDKTDLAKGYLNIKPVEGMSDQDASDFIAKEFEKAHIEAEFGSYDRLLSEVFNRSEEELDIKFDIGDNALTILDKFKAENWNVMDMPERMSAIKDLAKTVGKELGLDKMPELAISNDKNDDAYGSFNPVKNAITLNSNYFYNPVELVDTITHELRHAYQHARAGVLETREDALFKVNFDNYISPLPLPDGGCLFFMDYLNQYVEVDARAFANLFTGAML